MPMVAVGVVSCRLRPGEKTESTAPVTRPKAVGDDLERRIASHQHRVAADDDQQPASSHR
jgi:hypothetical protein